MKYIFVRDFLTSYTLSEDGISRDTIIKSSTIALLLASYAIVVVLVILFSVPFLTHDPTTLGVDVFFFLLTIVPVTFILSYYYRSKLASIAETELLGDKSNGKTNGINKKNSRGVMKWKDLDSARLSEGVLAIKYKHWSREMSLKPALSSDSKLKTEFQRSLEVFLQSKLNGRLAKTGESPRSL